MELPSNIASLYFRYTAVIPGIAVIAFPFLARYLGEGIALIVICGCCVLSARRGHALQKAHPEEIQPKELPMRLQSFRIMKLQVFAMIVVYAAACMFFRNLVIWIYCGGLLALSLIFLVHELIEVGELRAKRPNQPPEPTAMSVTPPAAQEPRQP